MKKSKDEFINLIVNDCIVDFRKQYKDEYFIIKEFIRLLRLCEEEIIIRGVDLKDVYLLASIVQLNKLYQSAILLFERGLRESANIIIRTIIEVSFKNIEVMRNSEFINELWLEQQYQNKKCLESIKNKKLFDLIPENKINELLEKVSKEINGNLKPNIRIDKLAEKNKLDKEYILYRLQCNYTHHSNSIIEGIIKNTEEGFFVDGNFQLENFKESVAWLISITLIFLQIFIKEYTKNNKLEETYNKFIIDFENIFKDLLD